MKIPKYKEFDNYVKPVIKHNCVKVLTAHTNGDEILSMLNSKELRELANYLDSLNTEKVEKQNG